MYRYYLHYWLHVSSLFSMETSVQLKYYSTTDATVQQGVTQRWPWRQLARTPISHCGNTLFSGDHYNTYTKQYLFKVRTIQLQVVNQIIIFLCTFDLINTCASYSCEVWRIVCCTCNIAQGMTRVYPCVTTGKVTLFLEMAINGKCVISTWLTTDKHLFR